MLLAIDVGNTNLTIGLYDGDKLAETWRLETLHTRTADEYGLLLRLLLEQAGYAVHQVHAVIVASVVPNLTRTVEQLAERTFRSEALVVGPGVKTGMPVLYDPPKDVGADRIVNAVAAFNRHKCACIVVDFGTATTFDSVTDRGEYAGGAIVPGIHVSLDALIRRAAKLPKIDLARPKNVVGKNTVESMQAGMFYGYVALVDGLVRRMRAEMKADPIRIVATGGLAELVAPDSETIEVVDGALTMEGLRLIYELNR